MSDAKDLHYAGDATGEVDRRWHRSHEARRVAANRAVRASLRPFDESNPPIKS